MCSSDLFVGNVCVCVDVCVRAFVCVCVRACVEGMWKQSSLMVQDAQSEVWRHTSQLERISHFGPHFFPHV